MNTRRSFFARIAGAVATIALAPELAFRAKLALPEVIGWDVGETSHAMTYVCNQNGVYEQLVEACRTNARRATDGESKLNMEELFKTAYEIKKQRQKAGISEHYILVKIES